MTPPNSKHPKTTPNEPSQRPIRGTKAGKPVPGTPPRLVCPTDHLATQLKWIAPLAKTADPTRNFHLLRFTGEQLRMTDGIAGVSLPFPGGLLADVVIPCAPLFQLSKVLTIANPETVFMSRPNKLEVTSGTLRVEISRMNAAVLPDWPAKPPIEVEVTPAQWQAVHAVSFGVNKNPQSLISLQAVALRKGMAMAADENRIVLQSTGLPATVDTLLMDRFLMLLAHKDEDPVRLGVGSSTVWAYYEDGTEIWGAIPAVPWPDSNDGIVKTHFGKLKGVKPDLVWEDDALSKGLLNILPFGDMVTVTAKQGTNTLTLSTASATGVTTELVFVLVPHLSSWEFAINAPKFQEEVRACSTLWYSKDTSVLVLKGNNGLYVIQGTIR